MDKDTLFQQYLDGELSPQAERRALHLFADDEKLRALLRFEQKFQAAFRAEVNPRSFTVPPGFSGRVMHRIEARKTDAVPYGLLHTVKRLAAWGWQPRAVRWRPAYAALVALLLAVAVSLPYRLQEPANEQTVLPGESVQPVSESSDKVLLRFVFIDGDGQARSVEVAGDFSNWEPIALTRQTVNNEQIWTGLVEMDRGQHQYMFIRNGEEWVTDPLAPVQQDDGFGNKNAVIYL